MNNPIDIKRNCDECAACCEGWLSGKAYDKEFFSETPCYYKCESGCSIYENRPEDPYKSYLCGWMTNLDFLEWFKPSVSKVIITRRHDEKLNKKFIEVLEMEQKIDSSILSWLFQYFLKTGISMKIQIGGGFVVFNSDKSYLHTNEKTY